MKTKAALPKDPDLAGVEKALKRAGKSARLLAKKTATPCYVIKDGKIVNVAERQPIYGSTPRKASKQSR